MTCHQCDTSSGEFDKRKLCCAVRFIEKATRDDSARLIAQTAKQFGHDPEDIKAGIASIRRERRKAMVGEVGR